MVADERDVIRLRTNYRKDPPEDVYVYRLTGVDSRAAGACFIDYMQQDQRAQRQARSSTTPLTTNCTTNIWLHSRVNPDHLPFSWKILASGYVPEYLYEAGRLDNQRALRRAAGSAPTSMPARRRQTRRRIFRGASADGLIDRASQPVHAQADHDRRDKRNGACRSCLRRSLMIAVVAGVATLASAATGPAGPRRRGAEAGRQRPKRPKICLVLSGGGARGAAHVGVIKVLEEYRVPIDCIAGTSMGALVGAAYATGHELSRKWRRSSRASASNCCSRKNRRARSCRCAARSDDYRTIIGPEIGTGVGTASPAQGRGHRRAARDRAARAVAGCRATTASTTCRSRTARWPPTW